jgi:membrane fusion protein (multidrug efflux system)
LPRRLSRAPLACALAAALVTTVAGCGAKHAPPPAPPAVSVLTVTAQDVPVYGDWVATLYGDIDARIQPEVTGYLVKQNYREGSLVHKGEVLFEIDPRPFQAAVDQAQGQLAQGEAQLRLARVNVERDTPLAKARAIAQSQLDTEVQSEAQYAAVVKSAEAALETAELNLSFTRVRTLIDGIAGIATTQIGNFVTQATTLTTVSKVDPIKAYFAISDPEYLDLASRIGPASAGHLLAHDSVPLTLTLSNGSVYPRTGRVDFVDREVDPQTGTIRLVGVFPNPDHLLREGEFAHVRAQTSLHKGAILVPQGAVNELQGRYQVAVVGADDKASIREVKPGDRVGQMWIIEHGLSAGERVVVDGFSKVKDGQTVAPTPVAPPPDAAAAAAPSAIPVSTPSR